MGDKLPTQDNKLVVEVEMNLKAIDSSSGNGATLSETPRIDFLNNSVPTSQSNSTASPSTSPSIEILPADSIDDVFGSSIVSDGGVYVDSETLKLAATLFEDAKSNRFIEFKHTVRSLGLYILYYKSIFKWLQYLAIFVILALATIEEPALALLKGVVPFWVCIIFELIAICYLGFRVLHLASFQTRKDFWGDKKNYVVIALIALSLIDIMCYVIWRSVAPESPNHFPHPIRWSRPLRPLFIINFPQARQIRRAFRNIRRTIVEIVFVLILFLFSVMIFALLALKLFYKKGWTFRTGDPYFQNYIDSLWSLYVLVTTANNPDVMMPAYDKNNFYALFFIIFLVVNLYVFMNVLLAVIFNGYKRHLKNEVQQAVFAKRRKLAMAFDLVKEKNKDKPGYHLSLTTWFKLMKMVKPKQSAEQVTMLFQVMDSDLDNRITKAEFLTSADLLNVPLTEVKDRMILWDKLFPKFFNNTGSKFIRIVVLHKFFRYFFDFAITVNAVFIALDITEAEWFFLALFTLEILLKLYVYGPVRFVSQLWNIFDVLVIGGAMIVTSVEAADKEQKLEGETLDFILVIRVLRLVKIVNGFDRFKIVVMTLKNIGPSIIIYGGVVFIFYYTFAIVGMEIFHTRIRYFGDQTYELDKLQPDEYFCGNAALNGSEFWMDRYCSNNFNDIAKAMVVLTELTVVNQWHVLTSGFVKVTHPVVKLYFLIFHLVVVVLIMNIFIAFILEAFLLEYSLSKSKFESQFEERILKLGYALGQKKLEVPGKTQAQKESILDDMEMEVLPEEGTRFHIRQSSKKVETLLQRMFENELDPEDIGLKDLDEEKPPRKYTLDSVVD
ncbi:two pore calcium channel protein 1-like [Watersipora subatra]|uniref:two pore calcium channel protein 1-like n=1 Tax=Watersipora subatra TaxID=2589382 RepID=UPI00355BB30C